MFAESVLSESNCAHARSIFLAAVEGTGAARILEGVSLASFASRPLDAYRHLALCAIGKAAIPLASTSLDNVMREGGDVRNVVCVVPHGYAATVPEPYRIPDGVEVIEAGHPAPDQRSAFAAHRILALSASLQEDDLLICLLSGGGTSLCAGFPGTIPVEDAASTFHHLMSSGADIHEMNIVRKRLSRMSGGRLAMAAFPAEVVTLAVSDVPGDDLSVIASGPTVPDVTTAADALDVLRRYELLDAIPSSVLAYLRGIRLHPERDTPDPGSAVFGRSTAHLLANNRTALRAGAAHASHLGYTVVLRSEPATGEARLLGPQLVGEALQYAGSRPVCYLSGGEATVVVRGNGRGGRCQETALAAGLEIVRIQREDLAFLSAGTDGVDGPTPAAGGCVTASSIRNAQERRGDARAYLARNDSHTFMEGTGMLLETGHTHTNVMDVQIVLVGSLEAND